MIWRITKSIFIVLLIFIVFLFLLLLPREIKITHVQGWVFTAEYPFNLGLYKERILEFFNYLYQEKGLGKTYTGVPVTDEVKRLYLRDFIIIFPSFVLSIIIGTVLGILLFYFREKTFGRILSVFSWLFSSIPDFFLYMAIQYGLIKLFQLGLPHFSLYGNDHWYNFIIPLLSLTLYPTIHIAKYILSSLKNEISEEYVRTLFAKGLGKVHVLIHMLHNCLSGILNQSLVIMVYILTSLPVIEKLSSYRGTGYQLLESVLRNEDNTVLGHMIPFLFIMFISILFIQALKHILLPLKRGELE